MLCTRRSISFYALAIRLTSVTAGFCCLKYGHWYFCDFSDGARALSFGCLLRTLTAVLRICLGKFLRSRILLNLGLTGKEELYACFPCSLNSSKSRHSIEVRGTVSVLMRTFHLSFL